MKKLLLAAGLLLCYLRVVAQASDAPPYDPAIRHSVPQLQADLAFLRHALEEAHPGLYVYTSKDSLDHYFDRTAAAITQPLNEQEYWMLLQPLVVRVRCGHTTLQHSPGYRAWLRKPPPYYFPFTVAIRQDRLFVVENQSTAPTLSTGTEILAIEGHPAGEILARLRALIAGDGYHSAFQDHKLEAGFFDEYYWAIYAAKPSYQLLIQDSTGQQQQLTPQPKPPKTGAISSSVAAALTPAQQQERRLLRLRAIIYPENLPSTALLRIKSFSYDELGAVLN